MAIIAHFKLSNLDQDKYLEAVGRLEKAGMGEPVGRLHHAFYGDGPDLRVTEIWDTPQHFEAFGQVLMPILGAMGVEAGPPEVLPVHNIIRG